MNAFASGVSEKIGFYVYLLIDPRDGAIFYVGKGIGDRCFAHLIEARRTEADAIGDYAKLARIRAIEAVGATVGIEILRHGLKEAEAFLVESAAIDIVGLHRLENRVVGRHQAELGRMSVNDVNAQYGAAPVVIAREHRVILIRISQNFARSMSDAALYETTRKWWKIGRVRRELDGPWSPKWAMAVYLGVVRAVYRIEIWEPPKEFAVGSKDANRWSFKGTRDQGMESIYLHRDVSRYLRANETAPFSQVPIRYIHCEP